MSFSLKGVVESCNIKPETYVLEVYLPGMKLYILFLLHTGYTDIVVDLVGRGVHLFRLCHADDQATEMEVHEGHDVTRPETKTRHPPTG